MSEINNTLKSGSLLEPITKQVNTLTTSVNNLTSLIYANNERISLFNIDMMKILNPSLPKPNMQQIEAINHSMRVHQLGTLNTQHYSQYCDYLWAPTSTTTTTINQQQQIPNNSQINSAHDDEF